MPFQSAFCSILSLSSLAEGQGRLRACACVCLCVLLCWQSSRNVSLSVLLSPLQLLAAQMPTQCEPCVEQG